MRSFAMMLKNYIQARNFPELKEKQLMLEKLFPSG